MTEKTVLRADARRNRERILEAAEEVFMEQGGATTLETVAKRAGVGIGTLYRRFATRDALLAATYSDRLLELAQTCRDGTPVHDHFNALRAYVYGLVTHINVYRGLAASIGMVLHSGTPGCDAIAGVGATLLRQAQENGAVRIDVEFDDLVYVITAVSLSIEQKGLEPTRVAHLISLFFDGLNCNSAIGQPL